MLFSTTCYVRCAFIVTTSWFVAFLPHAIVHVVIVTSSWDPSVEKHSESTCFVPCLPSTVWETGGEREKKVEAVWVKKRKKCRKKKGNVGGCGGSVCVREAGGAGWIHRSDFIRSWLMWKGRWKRRADGQADAVSWKTAPSSEQFTRATSSGAVSLEELRGI